jgi:hypothetical protein
VSREIPDFRNPKSLAAHRKNGQLSRTLFQCLDSSHGQLGSDDFCRQFALVIVHRPEDFSPWIPP